MPNEDDAGPIEHIAWAPPDEQIRAHVKNIREQLGDGGIAVMAVPTTETQLGYCHTIGLTDIGHPELVLATDSAPAMYLLDALAQSAKAETASWVTTPQWTWTDPWTERHTYDVRRLGSSPQDPTLVIVNAVYGSTVAHNALLIDILSCPCILCIDQVIIDADGNYLRDA